MPNAFTHTPLFNLRSHNLERTHFSPVGVIIGNICSYVSTDWIDKKIRSNQIPKVFPDYIVKIQKKERLFPFFPNILIK